MNVISADPSADGPSSPDNSTRFPAGSYSFQTFLESIDAGCTTNPATWQCYPYMTYNQSATGADTTSDWIISATDSTATNFTVSSTSNPFALEFKNASLHLINVGTDMEAYTFEVNLQKTVVPTSPLTPDGAATRCYYNSTTFLATMYTKRAKSYPVGNGTSTATGAFSPWPNAVSVRQLVSGGTGIPDCYKMRNGNVEEPITVGTEAASQNCQCRYQNFASSQQ